MAAMSLQSAYAAPTPAQQAYLKASNTGGADALNFGDNFGQSVAVSGDTIVVGAPYENSNATGVNGDQSNTNAPESGAAYVFVRNGTNWIQQAYLKASNTGSNDAFGRSVAVSGDTVVIGAYGEASNATGVNGNQSNNSASHSGATYVFVRDSSGNWSQQAYLKASNTDANDGFGYSVAVSRDTVVVGAWNENSYATGVNGDQSNNSGFSSGAAYVFVRSGTNWTQQAYLKASNTGPGDNFGLSVAVSGDTVVSGAYGEASNATGVNGNQSNNSASASGAAYVFVRSGTNWSQQAYLKASNTGVDDQFGSAVAVSGDTVVIGAYGEASNATGVNGNQNDNSATDSGAAYVFVRNGTTWVQQAYLKASNTDARDQLGISVAISGDTTVVGAYYEDSNATGITGNQTDNSATNSGAAYVLVRNGTNWSQQAYLKASNTGGSSDVFIPGDSFGFAVAVSGDTVVVGAIGEDSNATGVNGNQSDNSATDSGAAYVFTGLGFGTQLTIVPDASSGGYFVRFNGAPELTYRLQRASSVTGPWDTIDTQTAPASGLIEYHETTPRPAAAFYRTVTP
ncbi:MAG: FG-GAP repeat protein [Verrucomicrobia bacterium]|nr:FG-GAP repeat protein [Verrucomicrobiota bacterium]